MYERLTKWQVEGCASVNCRGTTGFSVNTNASQFNISDMKYPFVEIPTTESEDTE
jgi:hypothetical protein